MAIPNVNRNRAMMLLPMQNNNTSAQIIVDKPCAALTFEYDRVEGEFLIPNDVLLRVELVRKNQPNAVLFNTSLGQVQNLFSAINRHLPETVLPLTDGKTLLLSKDSYLQVDITFPAGKVEGVRFKQSSTPDTTNVPLSIKAIAVDGFVELDTQHYNSLYFDGDIDVETIVETYVKELGVKTAPQASAASLSADMSRAVSNANAAGGAVVKTGECGCDGVVKSVKVDVTADFLRFVSPYGFSTSMLAWLSTKPNQMVTLEGTGTVYLVQH